MSEKKSTAENAKKTSATEKVVKSDGFCVYLGPTITGVIQCGTVYRGTKEKVLKELKYATEKYPLIESLVVTDKTLSKDRIKVKTPGNILYVNYNKLLSGRK